MGSTPFSQLWPPEQHQHLLERWTHLEAVRSPMIPVWQEVGHYLMPHSGRFFDDSLQNRGRRKDRHIYDNTGAISVRHTAAGMMAGGSSPSRQWHRIGIRQPELEMRHEVKTWLDEQTELQRDIFTRAQAYRVLHQMYQQLLVFGTAVSVVQERHDTIIQMHPVPIGSFCLSVDNEERVDTMYRKFEMSVRQLIERFGMERVSNNVRQMWKSRQFDSMVKVVQAIEPRDTRDRAAGSSRNTSMPWRSVYFEHDQEARGILRESGYPLFPVVAPRWQVEPGEIYGRSPGMDALGDIKALQHAYLRQSQAIDYQTNPALALPTSLQNREVNRLPGGNTFVDQQGQGRAVQPMWEVGLQVRDLAELMEQMRERIRDMMFSNLFFLINSLNDTTQRTKAEIDERNSERMQLLGPALENMHDELLRPLVEITFRYTVDAGVGPPPPQELQGVEWNVEFVSALAQAQRSADIFGMEKIIGITSTLASTVDPNANDKLNADAIVDQYADRLGVSPDIIRSSADLVQLRKAREQALAAKEQVAAMNEVSVATRNLAASPTGEGTALADLQSSLFSAL